MALRLRSLTAENYKSLRQFRLEPKELTIFLGANAVGKSNIFDAFRFIKDRVERGFHSAISDRGGMELCAWRGNTQRSHHFVVKAEFDPPLEYSFGATGSGRSAAVREQLRSPSDNRTWIETHGETTTFHFASGGGSSSSSGFIFLNYLDHPEFPDPAKAFTKHVQGWQFYNFLPALMRHPGPASRQERLEENGSNFSSWLHEIQSGHRRQFDEILAVLKDGIQTTRDAGSELTRESAVSMFLEEEGLAGRFPFSALSDGTLRFLGHIAVLRQPVPPTMLFLEEPENYIHPRLLENLSEEIKIASLRFPILISTHSPLFVDKFEPSTVVIVERSKEGTIAVPVGSREDLQKLIQEMELELGDIWYSGALGGVRSSLD